MPHNRKLCCVFEVFDTVLHSALNETTAFHLTYQYYGNLDEEFLALNYFLSKKIKE